MHCPKCESEAYCKSGKVRGLQRYRCKSCGCNFTQSHKHGYPERLKELSVILYVYGLSMNAIARLLGVSHQTGYRWIKAKAESLPPPEISHTVTEVEIDEMCLHLKKRAKESGCGKCIVADPGGSLPGMWVLAMPERSESSTTTGDCR